MNRLLPILALLTLTTFLHGQNKPQTNFFLSTVEAAPGEQVCVDLTVADFRSIEALGLSIRWDTSALQFTEYVIDPDVSLTPNALNVLDEGVLLMVWTILPALTLPDDSSILQLCFTVKETNSSHFAYVAFDDFITVDVIVPEDLTGNPFVNASFHSGGVQINPTDNDLRITAQTTALESCLGRETGIDLTVAGGVPPYNFEWSGPNGFSSANEDIAQLAEGIYQVNISDQNGSQAAGRFLINIIENESEGVIFVEEAIITPTDCNAREGSIELMMVGDAADYTFSWNNGATTSNLSNLPSGDYSVTIANSQGCEYFANYAVQGLGRIIYQKIENKLDCNGNPAQIGVALPQPDLFFTEWTTGEFTPLIEVQEAGRYTLILDNGIYCVEPIEFNVSYDRSTLELEPLEAERLSCEGGTATIGVLNINPEEYYINWTHLEPNAEPIVTVDEPGEYFVEVNRLDLEGCSWGYLFEVGPPEVSRDYEKREEDLPCNGPAVIGLENTEGKNYRFDWGGGLSTPLIEVTEPRLYGLTLTEGNFCKEDIVFSVGDPPPAQFELSRIEGQLGCGQPATTIGVTAPEEAGFSFFWPHSGDTTATVEVSATGNYQLEVRNGHCIETYAFTVGLSTNGLELELIQPPVNCADTLQTIGAIDPLAEQHTFQWNTDAQTPTIEITESGIYYLTITESPVCTLSYTFDMSAGNQFNFTRILDDFTCADTTASIGIRPLEGEDYAYAWGNGLTTPTITVDTPGIYAVEIQKGNFCKRTEDFPVRILQTPLYFEKEITIFNCLDSTATITVRNFPDTLDLRFRWQSGDTTPITTVDRAGAHQLQIQIGDFCVENHTFFVESPSVRLERFTIDEKLSCDRQEAQIGVEMIGNIPVLYQWNTGDTDAVITVTESGEYRLTMTDEQTACTAVQEFTQPPKSLPAPEVRYFCPDPSPCPNIVVEVEAVGAQTPVIFSWSTGQVDTTDGHIGRLHVQNRYPVSVQITDATGCTTRVDNLLPACPEETNEDLRLRAYFACVAGETGVSTDLHAEMLSGGNPPYYFTWNTGLRDTSYFLSRTPFDENQGSYGITVTDQRGKQAQWSFSRTELYGCGPDASAVYFEAPHTIVPPESHFVYPVRIYGNFENLDRALFTIDWDDCLLEADSIVSYYPEYVEYSHIIQVFNGTYEIYFQAPTDTILPDTITIAEIYFRTTQEAEGISPFLFSINEPASYRNGETAFLRPVHGSITVASQQALVLPGDADNNYTVDHFDLLNLGLFYQGAGPERRLGLLREQEYAIPWLRNTFQSGLNLKHLDCNGDGLINALDTNVIALNWDVSAMSVEKTLENEEGPMIFVAGDTLFPGERQSVSVHLGEAGFPTEGSYGVAFTVEYDESVVTPESVTAGFADSWLGTNSETPPLVISRNDPLRNRIHLAIVRTDGKNRTGAGEIAKLFLTTRPETTERTAAFDVIDVRLINALEQVLPTNAQTSFLTVDQMTGTHQPEVAQFIRLYPVPAQDRLFIQHPPEITIQRAEIFDLSGRRMQEAFLRNDQLDVARLPAGIYFLRLITNEGTATKRWVKK